MSSASDPQDDRLDPTLPEAWLGEVFATAGEEAPSSGARALLVDGEAPSEEQLRALASAKGHLKALRSLHGLRAPAELEGRVVASLEAGFRQDRAVGLVAGLGAEAAPGALDPMVEARVEENLEGVQAPAVLGRLVEERVAAPAEGMVRSMAGRLDRKPAPEELDARVLEEDSGLAVASLLGGRVRRFAIFSSAAALVLVAVRLVATPSDSGSGGPSLRIIRVESLESVSASALDRAFLGSLTGEYLGEAR